MTHRSVIELFEHSAETFRSVLAGVRPEHHRLPTPCSPLDVSELVARAVGHQDWVRTRIAGHSDPPVYPPIEADVWMSALEDSSRAMVAELEQAGALDRTVTLAAELSFSGADVAVLAARNIFQFAWDLAIATDQSPDLAPDVASELYEISRSRLVPQRGPGDSSRWLPRPRGVIDGTVRRQFGVPAPSLMRNARMWGRTLQRRAGRVRTRTRNPRTRRTPAAAAARRR
jgi:uncharacterized protein (TIGR03086 family)